VPRSIDYGEIDRERSAWDEILACDGADPRSGNDLDRLEGLVRERLAAAVDAFPARCEGPTRGDRGGPRSRAG
jgi:hypothetical protein